MFWWLLATMVYPTAWAWFTITAFDWSPSMIGASFTWVGALMALSQTFLVGRVVRRLGERRAAGLGILAAIAAIADFVADAFVPKG